MLPTGPGKAMRCRRRDLRRPYQKSQGRVPNLLASQAVARRSFGARDAGPREPRRSAHSKHHCAAPVCFARAMPGASLLIFQLRQHLSGAVAGKASKYHTKDLIILIYSTIKMRDANEYTNKISRDGPSTWPSRFSRRSATNGRVGPR